MTRNGIKNGFTLIELMIVVAIIAILAAIAIPAYQDYVVRAQITEGLSLAGGAKIGMAEYWAVNGKAPESNEQAGMPEPDQITGRYVSSVDVSGGQIKVTMGREANAKIAGGVLVLVPQGSPETGSNTGWRCGSLTILPRYLPASCRDDLTPTPPPDNGSGS